MSQSKVHRIADELLLIERSLRQLGWWESTPPEAELLQSATPFCVDTLRFEQWLQWVLLARMKRLIEEGGTLPEASGVHAMAEQVYGTSNVHTAELLASLQRFDALIAGRD